MKSLSVICLLLSLYQKGLCQAADTFQVYFALDDTRVNEEQGKYLDSLFENDFMAPGHKVRLLGYTDYLGKSGHNDSLSRARAKSVQEHLLALGFKKGDITLCAGEGEIKRTTIKGGYSEDRKVLVISDKLKNRTPAPQNLIDINTVKVNEPVALKNIYFREGLPDIAPISYPELLQLYQFLKDNKTVTIQIEGHICCLTAAQGSDVPFEESTLSKLRARSVYDYLVSKGIDKARLKYTGLGNTRPAISPEVTEDDMESNRRVEIRLLSK